MVFCVLESIRMNIVDNKPDWFSEHSEKQGLSAEDQKWIWNSLSHIETPKENIDAVVNVNGTYKNEAKVELTFSKHKTINALNECRFATSPKQVASLLDELFDGWGTHDGHWLYIAQNWNPRAINRVMVQIIKRCRTGEINIQNPASYFTHLIKFRKKRRNISVDAGTNGTYPRPIHKRKVK